MCMWNYDKFKKGSFVEILSSPAVERWGVTVTSPTGSIAGRVYQPERGVVMDIFVDDFKNQRATVFFHCGIVGVVYTNLLKLIL
jgi:hypothetical protein